jgi:hypothetical protein
LIWKSSFVRYCYLVVCWLYAAPLADVLPMELGVVVAQQAKPLDRRVPVLLKVSVSRICLRRLPRVLNAITAYDLRIPQPFTSNSAKELRFDVVTALERVLQEPNSLAHTSTISTRSRTVQNVFVTPAAIAGVQRIAMLDLAQRQLFA